MKQWIVQAWDGDDEKALERRMKVREKHLAGARELKVNGNFVIGGAMLDDGGKMIGSTMIVQFKDEDELQEWLDREPYIHEGVWATWEVYPYRVADV